MATQTRDPAGTVETGGIAAVAAALGAYLATLVDDPNLQLLIVASVTYAANAITTIARNKLGAPLAASLGFGPMKGAATEE